MAELNKLKGIESKCVVFIEANLKPRYSLRYRKSHREYKGENLR